MERVLKQLPQVTKLHAWHLESKENSQCKTWEWFKWFHMNDQNKLFYVSCNCYSKICQIGPLFFYYPTPETKIQVIKNLVGIDFELFLNKLHKVDKRNVLFLTFSCASKYFTVVSPISIGLERLSNEFSRTVCCQISFFILSIGSVSYMWIEIFWCSWRPINHWSSILRNNHIRRNFDIQTCNSVNLAPKLEYSSLLTKPFHRFADRLLPNWSCGHSLAIDVRITSLLKKSLIFPASTAGGTAGLEAKFQESSSCEINWQDLGIVFHSNDWFQDTQWLFSVFVMIYQIPAWKMGWRFFFY